MSYIVIKSASGFASEQLVNKLYNNLIIIIIKIYILSLIRIRTGVVFLKPIACTWLHFDKVKNALIVFGTDSRRIVIVIAVSK